MNSHHIYYRSRCLTAGGQAAPSPPPPPPPTPTSARKKKIIINSHDAGIVLWIPKMVPLKQGPDDHVCAAVNAEARNLEDHRYTYRIANALH